MSSFRSLDYMCGIGRSRIAILNCHLPWHHDAAHDVLLEKLDNIDGRDGGDRLCFHPFREVIDGDKGIAKFFGG